mmetsp:Transcript_4916/g.7495  ORF Transcript_4916/g.7495 Transcript_4916/m.7495 type:complete len:208 (-) Transcript_4916:1461-2084(-)
MSANSSSSMISSVSDTLIPELLSSSTRAFLHSDSFAWRSSMDCFAALTDCVHSRLLALSSFSVCFVDISLLYSFSPSVRANASSVLEDLASAPRLVGLSAPLLSSPENSTRLLDCLILGEDVLWGSAATFDSARIVVSTIPVGAESAAATPRPKPVRECGSSSSSPTYCTPVPLPSRPPPPSPLLNSPVELRNSEPLERARPPPEPP